MGIAKRGEFFREIKPLIPPGFDQRPRAARGGQAMGLAQDASNGADFAILHRLPTLEDAVGASFGARIPGKAGKGRVGGEQPGQSYVGDQPEDGLGVVLHRTDTSLPRKAPRDERRSAGEGHTRPRRGPQMCRSPGKLNQNFRRLGHFIMAKI